MKGYTNQQAIENYMLITIDPSFSAQIEQWIGAAEDYIDRATDRSFLADSEATARMFSGDQSDIVLIDDCVAVTEVMVDDVLVPSTEYLLYPSNTMPKTRIKLLGAWARKGNQNVKVTAKWGYGTVVPGDIAFVATVLVAGMINFGRGVGAVTGAVASESIGRYSVSYATGTGANTVNDFVTTKAILDSYEKISL